MAACGRSGWTGVGIITVRRLALSAMTALVCSSCAPTKPQFEGLSQSDLPSELALPNLNGDAHSVVEQFCAWTRAHQIPFEESDVQRVRITAQHNAYGNPFARSSILAGFLDSDTAPRSLLIELDPHELFEFEDASLMRLRPIVVERGFWLFEKRPAGECADATASDPVMFGNEFTGFQCVSVRQVDNAEGEWTDLDYRSATFAVIVSGGLRQGMHVSVLTLRRAGQVIGRSIRTQAYAGPFDFGRVDRACAPALLPERFQNLETEM